MKIGFDISDLATGRADGTTRYTYELAKRLPVLAPEHEWLFFTPGPISHNFSLPSNHYSLIISPWPKYWTQTRLPWDLYKYQPDVMFMPIQQIPYLLPRKTKTVSTIHDLAIHKYPMQFRYKDWLLLHIFSAYSARQADRLIAVSQTTADDIKHYYGRSQNVHVIHHGVDTVQFHTPSAPEEQTSKLKLLKAFPFLAKPYLLYVGQLQPRKNITGLIGAFEIVSRQNTDLQLAIAGGHGWLQSPILQKISTSPAKNRIYLLGVVSDELLPALYWHAQVFVLPSFYEGFGMPLLEAMACGCPVVTSNTSSMPEVVGDAAILVNPSKTDDIAASITTALQNRDALIQHGQVRAGQFSWELTARKTLDVILNA